MAVCHLCNEFAEIKQISSNDNELVFCERCGRYQITEMLVSTWESLSKKEFAPILSGLCRELYETKQVGPIFTTTNYVELASSFPVPNMEDIDAKLEKLLAAVHRESNQQFGKIVELDLSKDYPLAYSRNREEFSAFIDQLVANALFKLQYQDSRAKSVILTLNGWKYFSRIGGERKPHQIFIAASASADLCESISAIETAIKDCGYIPMWVVGEHFQETIMDKALGELRRSTLAIIDLTGGSKNVFYEAGFAKALNIDVIYVYRVGEVERASDLAFYVRHYACKEYTSPEHLKAIIINAIRARK